MALVVLFQSSEYSEQRNWTNAFPSRIEWSDGQSYLWNSHVILTRNDDRVTTLDWQTGTRIMFTDGGSWPASLLGENLVEYSQELVGAILNRLSEQGSFPDKIITFSRWIDSRAIGLNSTIRYLPLFTICSWIPPTDTPTTLEFPGTISSKNNQIGSLIGNKNEAEQQEIFAKFETIRDLLGMESLEVFVSSSRMESAFPTVQAQEKGRLVIGGQAGTVASTEVLFLPLSPTLWDNVPVGNIVGGERRSCTLDDVPFCEVSSNTIWLLPRLLRDEGVLSYCLDGVIAFLGGDWDTFEADYLSNKEEGALLSWCETFSRMGPRLLSNMQVELEVNISSLATLERKMEDRVREITMYRLGLEALQGTEESWRNKGREEYLEISRNSNLTSFSFDGRTIKFTTVFLHMLHPQTEKYHSLGVLKVEFIPENGSRTVRVWNITTAAREVVEGVVTVSRVHPHIPDQGDRGCQGTLSGRLATLFGQGSYADAVQLLIFFFTTVNYDDVYGRQIDRWDLSNGTYGDITYREGDIIEA